MPSTLPTRRGALASLTLLASVAVGCTSDAQATREIPETAAAVPQDQSLPGMTAVEVPDSSMIFQGGPAQGALSPDGRWIVLARDEGVHTSLWLLPAEGGDPLRLTDGAYEDFFPAWAPTGDRLYFTSSRPSRGTPGTFIMSLDIDPSTGRPRGVPRQVTLEPGSSYPAPSPDGRLLAYRAGDDASEIRVAPTDGGNSRRVAVTRAGNRRLEWEPDGSAIYFVQAIQDRGGGLYRVPVGGGEPSLVLQLEGGRGMPAFDPARRLLLTRRDRPREVTYELVDFSGRVRWSGRLPAEGGSVRGAMGFSADGSLLGSTRRVLASIRVRPTQGGQAIGLAGAGDYDWPVSWTADSGHLIVSSSEGRAQLVRILSRDGEPPREVRLPDEAIGVWATPTHVSYSVQTGGDRRQLHALDLTSGETTVLADDLGPGRGPWRWSYVGPGGLYRDVNGFLESELVDGTVEILTLEPGAPRRVLARLPADAPVRTWAFQGEREAFTQVVGDSVAIMLAEPRGSTPHVLMMLGLAEAISPPERGVLAFSFDGSLLAVSPLGASGDALVVRVPSSGRATDILRVPTEADYWYEPRWLLDNSGFTVIAGEGPDAWVAFVPARPGERVRHLSRDEHAPAWGNEVSPDGRWVAYPAEVSWKMTLWKLDVDELLRSGEG